MATGLDVNRLRWTSLRPFQQQLSGLYNSARSIVMLTGACLLLSGCGRFYSADAISAMLVDADTKAPLPGVHVIAEWAIRGGMNYGDVVGYMNVMETVTDKDGRFHFPAWGPRPNLHFGAIFQDAPGLIFFKAGYRYAALANNGSVLVRAPSKLTSDWNRQTIPLPPQVTNASYDEGYISLRTDLEFLRREGHWGDIRQFLCALSRERAALNRRNLPSILYTSQSLREQGVDCAPEKATE
jgi:hypothetical protein